MIRSVSAIREVNKQTVRRFFETVLNEGRLELIDELIALDYLGHVSCVDRAVVGPAGMRRFVCSRRRRHPGLCVVIEDQLAEDDRVVTRWRAAVAPPPATAELNSNANPVERTRARAVGRSSTAASRSSACSPASRSTPTPSASARSRG